MHIVCDGFLTVARQAHIQGVSIHKTSSEDNPSLTGTLYTSFPTLHKALQASAGQ